MDLPDLPVALAASLPWFEVFLKNAMFEEK